MHQAAVTTWVTYMYYVGSWQKTDKFHVQTYLHVLIFYITMYRYQYNLSLLLLVLVLQFWSLFLLSI